MLQEAPFIEEIGLDWKMLPIIIQDCYSAIDSIDNTATEKSNRSFAEELSDPSTLKVIQDASVKNQRGTQV